MPQNKPNLMSPNSRFMEKLDVLSNLVITYLLWLLCCIPVFTIGAATKAMYANLFSLKRGEGCGVRSFFHAFKADFVHTTLTWLGILLAAVILGTCCNLIVSDIAGNAWILGLVLFQGVLLVLFAEVVFPYMSQFPDDLKKAAGKSAVICIANMPKMLLITMGNLLPLLLILFLPVKLVLLGIFLILFWIPVLGYWSIGCYERIFALRSAEER